jgi:hypothetical protein
MSAEPDPMLETRAVLRSLARALQVVAADAGVEIDLGGMAATSGGVPIVDASGRLVASV